MYYLTRMPEGGLCIYESHEDAASLVRYVQTIHDSGSDAFNNRLIAENKEMTTTIAHIRQFLVESSDSLDTLIAAACILRL